MRRKLSMVVGFVFATAAAGALFAQDYPAKTVRILVAYTPGGGTDLVGRVLAKKLGEIWGQQVVVENRPGAGGNIGTDAIAKAAPDGYTLGIAPSTHAIAPSLYAKLPFDTLKDFTFISLAAAGPNIVVCHPSVPVTSVKELIALAIRHPGQLTFASAGIGATTHLAGEYFKSVAGIDVLHIPYKGSSQAQIDLVGGQVSFMVDSMPSGLPKVQAGKTRALATTGKQRFAVLPKVPTVIEAGQPKLVAENFLGLSAPAGIDAGIANRFHAVMAEVLADPVVNKRLEDIGVYGRKMSVAEFNGFVAKQVADWAPLVKASGAKLN